MSQFKDVDPMQRTLANFVISGAASLKSACGNNFSGSETNDNNLKHDKEMDLPVDNMTSLSDDGCHQHCASFDFAGPLDSDHLSYLGHKCYPVNSGAGVNQRSYRSLKDEEDPDQVCNSAAQTFC